MSNQLYTLFIGLGLLMGTYYTGIPEVKAGIELKVPYTEAFIETNNIRLHVIEAGPIDGYPVLLLHGFPEFWYGWANQIEALVGEGYRVIVPDQRGYNLSDKPEHADAYRIDFQVEDAIGLLDALQIRQASVVGHDWGGVVAWWLSLRYPDRVSKVAILDSVHPQVAMPFYLKNPSQVFKSWYVFLFQLPWIVECQLQKDGCSALKNNLITTSNPGTFSNDLLETYREAWSQPGAIHAMANWYRRIFSAPPYAKEILKGEGGRVSFPVLILWGKKDAFLDSRMAEESAKLCDQGEVVIFDDAGHWLHHEKPEQVNTYILDFLEKH